MRFSFFLVKSIGSCGPFPFYDISDGWGYAEYELTPCGWIDVYQPPPLELLLPIQFPLLPQPCSDTIQFPLPLQPYSDILVPSPSGCPPWIKELLKSIRGQLVAQPPKGAVIGGPVLVNDETQPKLKLPSLLGLLKNRLSSDEKPKPATGPIYGGHDGDAWFYHLLGEQANALQSNWYQLAIHKHGNQWPWTYSKTRVGNDVYGWYQTKKTHSPTGFRYNHHRWSTRVALVHQLFCYSFW